jgi:UDP-N-acetylmuramoyl-L-alanyl-D-glutamate--2,6-diaminopimelate ligase
LKVIFGCGGDRDKGKREKMGAIAAKLADHVIITDDNPRSEDPSIIRAEIRKACPDAKEISPRDAAIKAAISDLKAGDTLLIAGKGHETSQMIGTETLPFDDASVARHAIAQIGTKGAG